MTRALFRKELRALRPWAVLSVFFGLMDIAEALVHQPDLRPLSQVWTDLGSTSGIALWIVAYAIGTGLVSREQDDGTLVFLDGLPVSRTHVFGVKCLSTCGLLVIAPSVSTLAFTVQHLLSRGSLDAELRLDILLELYALHVAAIIQGVFVGAAMGMLRSLTWLVTSAIAVSLSLLIERVPRSALLNPFSLLDVRVTAAGVALDTETLRAQFCITILAALIAWWGFARSGRASVLADLSKRPVLGATLTTLTVVALATAIGLAGQSRRQAKQQGGGEKRKHPDGGAVFNSSPPGETATKHYHFAYGATEAKQALLLAQQADDIFERVHRLIGSPLGDSIDVDTSGSARNTEGTAYFGRVRVLLRDNAPVILAHETSHVVAQRLAGGEHAWLWQKARVLDEGLATYVEQTFEAETARAEADATQANDRLLLAALYTRHELVVEEICDSQLLATMRDDNLKYPIGAAVIRAMVRLYGPDSIARLVRAFADAKLPASLAGLALMDTTFRIAGMDFAAVIAELFKQVADDAKLHAAELAALPRPRVRLVRRADSVGVQALCASENTQPAPRGFHLRFKPRQNSSFEYYDHRFVLGDRPVWRSVSQVRQAEVCAQVGLRLGHGRVLYEPWTCFSTADAAPWEGSDDDDEVSPDEFD